MNRQSPPSAGPAVSAGGWPKIPEKQPNCSSGAGANSRLHRISGLNWDTVCGSPPYSPYSQLGLVLPSKTPAKRESVETFAFAATAKRKFV
jgi:hypothetical protein